MDLGLKGKTTLVTGSGRGIGLAIAWALHSEGCNVALNSRSEPLLQAIASAWGEGTSIHVADVTQPASCRGLVQSVVDHWGGLDILVCNVGSGASVAPGQETSDEWQRVFNLNLFSTTNMVEVARSFLQPNGVILCVSSICGLETLGAPVTYSAAKAALNHYVSGIARPLAKEGIRIVAIAPGNILTEGGVWEDKLNKNRAAVEDMLTTEVALQRLGKPEEIADIARFLVSERASFITGTVVVVDGGQVRG
ncbi:MAG: SDR family NAD(P)-dependent oxidoreductase [Cyanobacteria bacterium P01_H01_bin.21]